MVSFLLQDEVLFDSWDAIFNKGKMKDATIYSFDGMDILTNAAWSVVHDATLQSLLSLS
jgi:hypothetical protein